MPPTTIPELQREEARLRSLGRYDEALAVLDRILEQDANFADALNNKAAILLMRRDYGNALPFLRRAVQARPGNGQAWNNLGLCLYNLGHYQDAANAYVTGLDQGYTHEGVDYNLGCVLLVLGRTAEGIACWEDALRKNPIYRQVLELVHQLSVGMGIRYPWDPVDHLTILEVKRHLDEFDISAMYSPDQGFLMFAARKH